MQVMSSNLIKSGLYLAYAPEPKHATATSYPLPTLPEANELAYWASL